MLWTEVVQPQSLTTVARETLDERERSKNILAQFLPNRVVDDISVSLSATTNGLVEVAEYRAYDAETPIGAMPGGKKISLELPPLGQKIPVSEYDRLRARGISFVMQKLDPYIIVVGRSTPLTGVRNMLSQAMSLPSASPVPTAITAIPSSTPMRAAMTRTTSEGAGRGQDGQQRRQER